MTGETKRCSTCALAKPLGEFYRGVRYAGGYRGQCKSCSNAKNRDYLDRNPASKGRTRPIPFKRLSEPDEIIAANRQRVAAWQRANPERASEHVRAWRAAHPEAMRKYRARWDAVNRDVIRVHTADWKRKNPEKCHAHETNYRRRHSGSLAYRARSTVKRHRRRARMANAPRNDLTATQWQQILDYYDYRCAYCLRSGIRLQQEHMNPIARGGEHSVSNVVPACGECNAKKGAARLAEFLLRKVAA